MRENDIVYLQESYEGLPAGAKGTILLIHSERTFEVEFSDKDGNPLTPDLTLAVPISLLSKRKPS